MAKITRVFQNLFGSSGSSGDFGQFGSKAAGAPAYTKDPATIQSLARFLTGWADAVVSGSVPELEDMNSLFLLAFYQICYLLQQGIAEYDASTTYFTGSLVNVSGAVYASLADNNIGNTPASSPAYWALAYVDTTSSQSIGGVKSFTGGIVIETRTSDPTTPATGRIWLRSDL